jgi:hypothetical protein
MGDDLNHPGEVTEPGQDDVFEYVPLKEGTAPANVAALVVERARFYAL